MFDKECLTDYVIHLIHIPGLILDPWLSTFSTQGYQLVEEQNPFSEVTMEILLVTMSSFQIRLNLVIQNK